MFSVTDRQTEGQIDRQAGRQKDKQTGNHINFKGEGHSLTKDADFCKH